MYWHSSLNRNLARLGSGRLKSKITIKIKIGKKPFRLNFNGSGAGVRASVTRDAGTKDTLDELRAQWGLKYPME